MTSNHFLLIILYFISNFFIFIAEASASSDQELKAKFFNDQCQTGCSEQFRSCYQKISSEERIAIMNGLISEKYIQKLSLANGSNVAYTYGSDKYSVPLAKAKFNEVVAAKCNAIATAAQAKAAQASAAGASSGSSRKSSGGDSRSLVDAAKQMAPVALAIPGVKEAYDKVKDQVKDKAKEVVKNVGKDIKETFSGNKPEQPEAGSSNVSNANSSSPNTNSGQQLSAPTQRAEGGIIASNGEIGSNMGRGTKSEIRTPAENNQPTSSEVIPPEKAPTVAGDKAKAAGQIDNPVVNDSKEKLKENKDLSAKSEEVTKAEKLEKTDAKTAEEKAKIASDIEQLNREIQQTNQSVASTPAPAHNCVPQLTELKSLFEKYVQSKKSCGENAASAGSLCSLVRSETVQGAQLLISVGTAAISKATAASESCGIMSNVSLIANGGMLAAQTMCSGFKFRCDFSCKDAVSELATIETKLMELHECAYNIRVEAAKVNYENYASVDQHAINVENAHTTLTKLINAEKERSDVGSVVASTKQCEAHTADILTMGAQAAALFSAAMDSKKCEEQLSSNDGGGGSGKPIATTAQFCAQAANASSITCRCAADPSGAGCLGTLGSGSDPSAFAGLQKGVGNVSGFASTGGPKITGSDIEFSDLPKDNTIKPDDGSVATSPFGAAAAAGSGGGGGGAAGSPSGSSDGGGAASEEKSKFAMGISSLAKGFGNLFGSGNGGGKPATKSLSKQQQEVQLQAIKRKLASDQVRAEISTASGKSNFDKIKARYTETRSSLIAAP